jgi:predicted Zn-dependent protease
VPFALHYRNVNDATSAMKFIDAAITAQPDNAHAYALGARWRMELNDFSAANTVLQEASRRNLSTFELHKCGMELALKLGDVDSAFCQLESMTRCSTADLSPLKNRLKALAAKMSALPIS